MILPGCAYGFLAEAFTGSFGEMLPSDRGKPAAVCGGLRMPATPGRGYGQGHGWRNHERLGG